MKSGKMETPPTLILKTRRFMARHGMLDGVRRLGVAVSGGADSMALLHVLHALRDELAIELAVAHVNHGLRGAESDEDERFVREAAGRMGLEAFVHRIAPGVAPATGVELWAREQRLDFFTGLIGDGTLDRIATGHTQRDQAETILFRLLRGAGPRGLSGISAVSPLGILRPLLWASREEVLCFLEGAGIGWREDASNTDPRFARNRLRHEWLPALREAWNPQLDKALAHSAEIFAQESEYLDRIADEEAKRLFAASSFGWETSVDALRAMDPALLRRVLRALAAKVAGSVPDFRHLERVQELATGPAGYGRFACQGVLAERSGEAFRVAPLAPGTRLGIEPDASLGPESGAVTIPGPGRYSLPGVSGELELAEPHAGEETSSGWNGLNSGYTEGWGVLRPLSPGCALLLRRWRPGDVFQPSTSNSTRKLKDLFQRAKTPRWRRVEAAVLEMDGEIVWCRYLGVSASHGARGTDGTETRGLRVHWREASISGRQARDAFVSKENG